MSNVIAVLVKMASNADMSNTKLLAEMLSNAKLSKAQELAIQTKNIDALTEVTYDLTIIKCYPLLAPKDTNEEETTRVNQIVANF